MTNNGGSSPFSLGIVGDCSSAKAHAHLLACGMDGRWSLDAGVFGGDRAQTEAMATRWQVSADRAYATWRDLVLAERSRLDAVAVLAPGAEGYEIIQNLLKAGMPVIAENPLATGLNDARLLLAMHEPSKNFVAVTSDYGGYPLIRELRARIAAGQFGNVQQLHIEIAEDTLVRRSADLDPAALHDEFIPGICLDKGLQLHHLVAFLCAEQADQINAEFSTYSRHRNIVDNVSLWAAYPSGMSACFWLSQTAAGRGDGLRIRLYGELGSAEWCEREPDRLRIVNVTGADFNIGRGGQALLAGEARYSRVAGTHASGFVEAFANVYTDIADALCAWRRDGKHNNAYVPGLQDATAGLAMFHAARLSSSRRRWERIQVSAPQERLAGRFRS